MTDSDAPEVPTGPTGPDGSDGSAWTALSSRSAREAMAASRGDPDRFAEVFDAYYPEIYRYVARRLGPDLAEDVAAETFLQAFRRRSRFDPDLGEPRAWLYGIATNLIRRHRRTEERAYRALRRLPVVEETEGPEERALDRVGAESARGPLAGALAALSPGDRDVLLLIALAGLGYQEVAAALGIAYGTVCSRLGRARRKVRAALAGTVGEHWPGTVPARTVPDRIGSAETGRAAGNSAGNGPLPRGQEEPWTI